VSNDDSAAALWSGRQRRSAKKTSPLRATAAPAPVIELVAVESLRPTQVAVGMRAVTWKRRKLEARVGKGKPIDKILSGRPLPAVRGPGRELYIVDNHHFGLALWQAEVESVYARVIEDCSALAPQSFWRHMEGAGRLYPFDENGERISPSRLPTWLHALRHDPFRDLAWQVREAGGFAKVATPFAEFRWATFFRHHISLATVRRNHEACVRKAMKLCRAREAAHLPGYIAAH
jgi:hypothetical protein